MPFYTGKSADGSDMKEFEGFYATDDGKGWCSHPPPGRRRKMRLKNDVLDYMNARFTLDDVKQQILNKTCPLSRSRRDYVMSHYDEDGNFKEE